MKTFSRSTASSLGVPGGGVDHLSDDESDAQRQASIEVDAAAFSFPHRIELTIVARERALTIVTTAIPTGDRPVPIAFGWHPYRAKPIGTARSTTSTRSPTSASCPS